MFTWEVHSHPTGLGENGRREYSFLIAKARFQGSVGYLIGSPCLALSHDYGRTWLEKGLENPAIGRIDDFQLMPPHGMLCIA
jgi:hypothetical protein